MKRAKPVYCDTGALRDRIMFKLPVHRHPLHGADARIAATWLQRWMRRNKIPIGRLDARHLRGARNGTRALRASEWNDVWAYCQRVLREREQQHTVTLRLQVGLGGLRLTR